MSNHDSEAAYAAAEIASIMQERQNHFFEGVGVKDSWSLFAGREGGSQWPLADGVISASNQNIQFDFAFEFKRTNEGIHGILTALGQSFAYLEKGYKASVMAFPSKYSSHPNPGNHIKRIIEATSPDVPIWVFTYDAPDLSATRPFYNKITCVRENPLNSFGKVTNSSHTPGRITTLWAHVREGMSHPDALFRFCQSVKIVSTIEEDFRDIHFPQELVDAVNCIAPNVDIYKYLSCTPHDSILDKAWRRVWFNYYFWNGLIPIYNETANHEYVVNDTKTRIMMDDSSFQSLFSGRVDSIKNKLVKLLNNGGVSKEEVWQVYAQKVRSDSHSYREVIDSGLYQIGLISADGTLTDIGYKFVDACEKKNSAYDPLPMDILSAAYLQNGQYITLLHYIFKYSEELFDNDFYAFTETDKRGNFVFKQNEYLSELMRYFDKELHIVQKATIRSAGERRPFQAELTLMKKLGIIRTSSNNSIFKIGTGLIIDWPQVESSLQFYNSL